ncbi:MAG: hypothetical protein ACRC33_17985, partial [Gemmataceae bacterium]
MTKENKAGLVVASSFLALVAVVLAAKCRQQPAAEPSEPPTPALSLPPVKPVEPEINLASARQEQQPAPEKAAGATKAKSPPRPAFAEP